MSQQFNVEDLIRVQFSRYPHTKDNDRELIARIYWALSKKGQTLNEFLRGYAEGRYPTAEAIRRTRARIQKKYPELRGKNYENRANNQKVVVQNLKDNKNQIYG